MNVSVVKKKETVQGLLVFFFFTEDTIEKNRALEKIQSDDTVETETLKMC